VIRKIIMRALAGAVVLIFLGDLASCGGGALPSSQSAAGLSSSTAERTTTSLGGHPGGRVVFVEHGIGLQPVTVNVGVHLAVHIPRGFQPPESSTPVVVAVSKEHWSVPPCPPDGCVPFTAIRVGQAEIAAIGRIESPPECTNPGCNMPVRRSTTIVVNR
jgi:hypothetical protein